MNQKICKHCRIPHYFYAFIKAENKEELVLTSISNEKSCVLRTGDEEFMDALFDNGYTYHHFIPFGILRKIKVQVSKDCPYHLEHQLYDWNKEK